MSNDIDVAEKLPYEDFYYIKLIPGEKNPIEAWGGYGNDPEEAVESDDEDINVYTHEEVLESDHEAWGIVGIKGDGRSLLVYDLDIYKADDFDPDEIIIDGTEGVPVVKSPSGGLHVYTAVYEERARGSESDFSVADELPFDIDIRGSFVSMHPVAPNAIPGVGGDYELTNDVPIMTHSGVRDSVAKLKFAESGEPIISYDVDTGVGDFSFERSGEAPDEMPTCYHAALQLREADPDDHPSLFKVDSLAAMCGVATGYSKEEMMQHFLEDFSPGAKADREKTSTHLARVFKKMGDGDLAPPAVSTLREWGILEDDETCDCDIDYHGGSGGRCLTDSSDLVEQYEPDVDAEFDDLLEYDHIHEILDGERYDDPEERDESVCRAAIQNGVSEEAVRERLTESPHSKVGDQDAAADYWSGTWEDAHERVAELNINSDGSEVVEDPETGEETRLPAPDISSGFKLNDGCYGVSKTRTNEHGEEYSFFVSWTNFQLELRSVIREENGDLILRLRVHPTDEPAYDVSIEPTTLNEIRSFKKEVCTGRTTTWDADHSALAKLKQFVGAQDAKERKGTGHMGLNDGLWLTPDGALGPDGWVDDTDSVYMERSIAPERAWQLSPDDGSDYDPVDVAEMVELLVGSRDSERFLPVLGWFYAATLRPYIMDWEGEFNLLTITGETGAGKTTTSEALWPMFGMNKDGVSIGQSTEFTLLNALSSTNSIPMWFDEYKPNEIDGDVLDAFHQGVRAATKGAAGSRGNADKSDDGYRMHAPVVVTGEERLRGSAEERRGIYTVFKKDSTRPGSPHRAAYEKLTGGSERLDGETRYYEGYDLGEHALAWLQWLLSHEQDDLHELWRECDEWIVEYLGDHDIHVDEDLVRQGLQTVKFGCELMRTFERDMRVEAGLVEAGESSDSVVSDEEIEAAIEYLSTGEESSVNRKTHLDTLFEVAGRAATADYLEEGTHYGFVHKGAADEELRINLNEAFDKIRRYVRDHGLQVDLFSTKNAYDQRLADEIDQIPYVTRRKQWTEGIGSSVGIDTETAAVELDGFGRWQFDEDIDGATRSKWQALDTVESGRASITVRCTQVERNDLPDSMAERGTFEDDSQVVDYVMWERDTEKVDGPTIEKGGCYSIRGAMIGEYEDAKQVKLDGAVTITEVEPGFEHIETPDSGTNQDLTTAAADAAATSTDGGEAVQLVENVESTVEAYAPAGRDFITGLLVGQGVADDPAEISAAIDRLETNGRIIDYGEGYVLVE